MSHLAKLQAEFQAYLMDDIKGLHFIKAVIDDKKVGAKKRLGIYFDAYRLRIIEALATAYPQLKALLGDVLFNKIAREYIDAYPSTYLNLRWYGSQMRDHLQETLAQHPIAAEMAHFEWTLSLAFDAEDVPELSLQDLAKIPLEKWADLSFEFQPAIKVFQTSWNTIPVWQALESEKTPPKPAKESQTQTWIIWRKDFNSQFRLMTETETAALEQMVEGASFGEICARLAVEMDGDKAMITAAQFLANWLQDGMISAVNGQ
jgi:hypothetical protein